MTSIKNKPELIEKINLIINNQANKRQPSNIQQLSKIVQSESTLNFLNSGEKKVIKDTVNVLIDFYNESKDTDKGPNNIPDNFFKKILDESYSTGSELLTKVVTDIKDTSAILTKVVQGNLSEEMKTTINEKASNDIDKTGEFSEELETIINENSNQYIPNDDIEKFLSDSNTINKSPNEPLINSKMKVLGGGNLEENTSMLEKDTIENTSVLEKDSIATVENEINTSDIENNKHTVDISSLEITNIKNTLEKHMKSTIDNLFQNIDKTNLVEIKKAFTSKVVTFIDSLMDKTLENTSPTDNIQDLIIQYNIGVLDFLEHKLTLE